MKILILLVAFSTSVRGTSVTMENVEQKLRLIHPVLMMGEEIFRLENKNNCIEKMFCLLETSVSSTETTNPLQHYAQVLTNSRGDFDRMAFEEFTSLLKIYPHFSKMAEAIKIGQTATNSSTCHAFYQACKAEEDDVVTFAALISDDNAQHFASKKRPIKERKNTYCDTTGLACGVAGGGCALCAVATEGVCAIWCAPEVGAYCGGTGIGCSIGSLFG